MLCNEEIAKEFDAKHPLRYRNVDDMQYYKAIHKFNLNTVHNPATVVRNYKGAKSTGWDEVLSMPTMEPFK